MTTLLTRLVGVLERGVVALERIADATESIAAMTAFHESGHLDDPEPARLSEPGGRAWLRSREEVAGR